MSLSPALLTVQAVTEQRKQSFSGKINQDFSGHSQTFSTSSNNSTVFVVLPQNNRSVENNEFIKLGNAVCFALEINIEFSLLFVLIDFSLSKDGQIKMSD